MTDSTENAPPPDIHEIVKLKFLGKIQIKPSS